MKCDSKDIINNELLNFISDNKFETPFINLKHFLEAKTNGDPDDFLKNFFDENITNIYNNKKQANRLSVTESQNSIKKQDTTSSKMSLYESKKSRASSVYSSITPPSQTIDLNQFEVIIREELMLPSFFTIPLMVLINPDITRTGVFEFKFPLFMEYSARYLDGYDVEEQFFNIFDKDQKGYIVITDLSPFISSLVQTHISLNFLENDVYHQSAFVKCILARIFYSLDMNMNEKITYDEFMASRIVECMYTADESSNISDETLFFSYEHFYVIFTRFWELDRNETGKLDAEMLSRYDNFRFSKTTVQKIMNTLPFKTSDEINLFNFVYFILAVEDKTSLTSLNIWFSVFDTKKDNVLSEDELRDNYEAKELQMKKKNMDPLEFKDILPFLIDITHGERITKDKLIQTEDWDSFISLVIDFKENDGYYIDRDPDKRKNTWKNFCANEYTRLSKD